MELIKTLYLVTQPIRWQIVQLLLESSDGLTPTYISARLHVEVDTISHHLVRLRDENLIVFIPSGHNNIYFPNRERLSRLGEETKRALHKETI